MTSFRFLHAADIHLDSPLHGLSRYEGLPVEDIRSATRTAFDNLGKRTGLPGIKSVATALIQAERYGTPVGQALRVMAKENREARMAEAEKKAAALPPKLTVPMIVFFMPVLFVVILGPAIIQIQATLK